MIISKSTTAQPFQNSPNCEGVAYEVCDDAIEGAVIAVNGRYPDSGFLINEICKELVYITAGSGELISRKFKQNFTMGDVVFVDTKEEFAWQGEFEGFFVTTPRFDPAQHTKVPA